MVPVAERAQRKLMRERLAPDVAVTEYIDLYGKFFDMI